MSASASSTVVAPPVSRMEKLKNGAAILGAVASAVVGLYGVYEKVRSDARADTAASYNTLAPQVNQMNEAVKQLQLENQQLREIVAHGPGKARIAAAPAAVSAARRKEGAGRSDNPGPTDSTSPSSAATPAAGTASAPAAPAAPPTAVAVPAAPAATPGTEDDRISDLLRTVGRTREAIESLKKVPEDFGRVVGPPAK